MIFTVESTNPNYTYILNKKPSSVKAAGIRGGQGVCWFTNLHNPTFVMAFIEGADTNSFGSDTGGYDYNNVYEYSSPEAALALLAEFAKDALNPERVKEAGYDTTDGEHQVFFRCIALPYRYISSIAKLGWFDGVTVNEYRNDSGTATGLYQVSLISRGTFKQAMQKVAAFMYAACRIMNPVGSNNDDDFLARYLGIIAASDAPYLVRYHAKRGSNRLYHELNTGSIALTAGDTHQERIRWVAQQLDVLGAGSFLDYGAGEGRHAKSAYNKDRDVYVYDIDDAAVRVLRGLERNVDNITFVESDELTSIAVDAVVLSEVIEHMDIELASQVCKMLLELHGTLVITTPNRDFNVNYGTTGVRRADHLYEYSVAEFTAFVNGLIDVDADSATIHHVGDTVNGQGVSLGAIVRKGTKI